MLFCLKNRSLVVLGFALASQLGFAGGGTTQVNFDVSFKSVKGDLPAEARGTNTGRFEKNIDFMNAVETVADVQSCIEIKAIHWQGRILKTEVVLSATCKDPQLKALFQEQKKNFLGGKDIKDWHMKKDVVVEASTEWSIIWNWE